jgi:hypothetical protein
MLDQEAIAQQLDLLAVHRRTLAHLLRQTAQYGGAVFAPPQTANGIAEARAEIRRIKTILRGSEVIVEDEPNDEGPPQIEPLQQQQAGDSPATIHSAGRSYITTGGDHAGRDIDKRQGGAFVEGNAYGNIIGQQTNYYQTVAASLDRQQQRNRRTMLAKVKSIWIEGLLEQSLAKELRIALDMAEQPDAVDLPLNILVQELRRLPRELPTGTPIIKVFDQMGGALLILGAPGAGKTTLLLELARDLIALAERDESHPIPIVFSLSSWAEKRRPLEEWLVEELNTKYDVPRKVAQEWAHTDTVLPLLDGLDEVAVDHRETCVEAINTYRQAHGLLPVVVCSRVVDYDALTTKLRLGGAVVVQPLTEHQVDTYLEQAGEVLTGLRAALRDDLELWELVDNPLMLSIVALAYKDMSPAKLRSTMTPSERRRQLFDDYIAAMFQRRGKVARYSPQQTLHWLCWLARGMTQQAQTLLLLERLQPEWLPSRALRFQYVLLDRCIGALLCGLIFGLLATPVFDSGSALLGALVFGMVTLLFGGRTSIETLRQRPIGRTIIDVLIGVLAGVLVGGLVGGLTNGLASGLANPLAGMFSGLLGGAVGGLLGVLTGKPSVYSRQVIVIERLHWEWRKARRSAVSGLLCGLGVGLIFGALSERVFGLVGGLESGQGSGLVSKLLIEVVSRLVGGQGNGLVVGLVFGLLGGLLGGLSSGPLTATIQVNEGIRRSARSALVGGLVVGLVFGLMFTLLLGLLIGLLGGLLGGLIFGLLGGLSFGGYACLSHLALRLVLSRNGYLPLHLVRFLDYAAERIFLRKVGGGYIFVHRLLMEHFASLYNEPPIDKTGGSLRFGNVMSRYKDAPGWHTGAIMVPTGHSLTRRSAQ